VDCFVASLLAMTVVATSPLAPRNDEHCLHIAMTVVVSSPATSRNDRHCERSEAIHILNIQEFSEKTRFILLNN